MLLWMTHALKRLACLGSDSMVCILRLRDLERCTLTVLRSAINTFDTALICHCLYWYLVTNFGNAGALLSPPW